MFFASNICCVSSGTVNARYCWEPRDVSGAKPFMKKCLVIRVVTRYSTSPKKELQAISEMFCCQIRPTITVDPN